MGCNLEFFDIVVINMVVGVVYGCLDYLGCGCGIGCEVMYWLMLQGICIVGMDVWFWDVFFFVMVKCFVEIGDVGLIWEGYKVVCEGIFLYMEKFVCFDELLFFGFIVFCFLVKIKGGLVGWCCVIVMLEQ